MLQSCSFMMAITLEGLVQMQAIDGRLLKMQGSDYSSGHALEIPGDLRVGAWQGSQQGCDAIQGIPFLPGEPIPLVQQSAIIPGELQIKLGGWQSHLLWKQNNIRLFEQKSLASIWACEHFTNTLDYSQIISPLQPWLKENMWMICRDAIRAAFGDELPCLTQQEWPKSRCRWLWLTSKQIISSFIMHLLIPN